MIDALPNPTTLNGADCIRILGVRIEDVDMQAACDLIKVMIESGGVHQVATVNPEFIIRARRDATFARVLEHTELNVPDGVGVIWAARRQGRLLHERVSGADLLPQLCARGSQYGWRVFFLGAKPGVAERAAANMAFQYQGLVVAGARAGSPHPDGDADSLAVIERAKPHLLFVAYGAPEQEHWLARNLPRLAQSQNGLVGIGVGGSFDYVSGIQKRASLRMQRLGLEWLYRLMREPRRFWRQLALVRFVIAVLTDSRATISI